MKLLQLPNPKSTKHRALYEAVNRLIEQAGDGYTLDPGTKSWSRGGASPSNKAMKEPVCGNCKKHHNQSYCDPFVNEFGEKPIKINKDMFKDMKLDIKIVPSGRIHYCVDCDAEHGYDCPKDYPHWKSDYAAI